MAVTPIIPHAQVSELLKRHDIDPKTVLIDGYTEEGYFRLTLDPDEPHSSKVHREWTPWSPEAKEAIVTGFKQWGLL